MLTRQGVAALSVFPSTIVCLTLQEELGLYLGLQLLLLQQLKLLALLLLLLPLSSSLCLQRLQPLPMLVQVTEGSLQAALQSRSVQHAESLFQFKHIALLLLKLHVHVPTQVRLLAVPFRQYA